MNKTSMNLQDNFLNQARRDNVPVTIYLISGVQLKGIVRGFDAFTVVLESPGKPGQLVYKHSIASVVPARPISVLGLREEREPASASQSAPVREAEAKAAPEPSGE